MSYKIFKALSDPTRLEIIKLIGNKEICACKIPKKVGKSQPNVSQHLKKLETTGILECRRVGKMMLYRVKDRRIFKLIKICEEMR